MSLRTSPPQLSFSSGEISPLLHRRADYQRFQTGLRSCNGFLPLRQGGVTRIPGTYYRGQTHENRPARLISFVFAVNDAIVLEFTRFAMRVWRYGSLVEASPGVPYVLETPYNFVAIQRLSFVQSADVIYLADGARPIHKLSRFDLDNWTIEPLILETGPFGLQSLDDDPKITVSGSVNTITLTSSAPLFEQSHVGTLFRLEAENMGHIPLWTPDQAVDPGLMRWDRNVYYFAAGKNTGINPPTHDIGTEKTTINADAVDTEFTFISEDYGIVRVTGVLSPTRATALVVKGLPPNNITSSRSVEWVDGELEFVEAETTDTVFRWSEQAWSDRQGYPACVEIYEQRLCAAATPSAPRTIWFSAVGDFADFNADIEADSAFSFAIAGTRNQNAIQWLKAGTRALHIGALGDEYSTRSEARSQVIGPTTARFGLDSTIGSAPIVPITPDGEPIFISRDRARVFALRYAFEADRNQPTELSLPAEHLGQAGLAQIEWQSSPLRTAWMVRADGVLLALVFDPAEDVLGWARCTVAGGACRSVAVVPELDTSNDTMFFVVERQVNGASVFCVEEQAHHITVAENDPDECYLFSAVKCDFETPQTTVSLPHLAGKAVTVTLPHEELVLQVNQAGVLTCPQGIQAGLIGLFDVLHEAETLDVTASAADGSTLGRPKRLHAAGGIALHRTGQALISCVERKFSKGEKVSQEQYLVPVATPYRPPVPQSGVFKLQRPSGHAEELSYRIRPVGNSPLTLTALTPRVQETG